MILVLASFATAQAQVAPAKSADAPIQTTPTAPERAKVTSVEAVVVTGTRLPSGFQSPSPITVISAETLEKAAPLTIEDAINELPQFKGSPGRAYPGGGSAGGLFGSLAGSQLNLRNLGPKETLILLNGSRTIPTTVDGTVDIDTLPQSLVSRVDVVAAGGSAAYGSDAVAGVVNFILDTKFDGLKLEAKGGYSNYGDLPSYGATITYGTGMFDGHAHFEFAAEYFKEEGIGPFDKQRPWVNANPGVVNLPAGTQPARQIFPTGVNLGGAAPGGLITSGLLKGTSFGPGGTLQTFTFGNPISGLFEEGGSGTTLLTVAQAPVDRKTAFARFDFDITPQISAYVQGRFSDTENNFDQTPSRFDGATPITIFSGNPFIPAALQAQMTSRGIASFPLARLNLDMPATRVDSTIHVYELTGGIKGSLWGFDYDGTAQIGQSEFKALFTGELNFQNAFTALDAVVNPANGQTVCNATLTGAQAGCVPFNPFGQGSPSKAAIAYITAGSEYRDITYRQALVELNVTRKLFSLWSDPIGFAAGVGYRHLSLDQEVDGSGQQRLNLTTIRGVPSQLQNRLGLYFSPNFLPFSGAYDVSEVYSEVNVPILKDQTLIKSLDVDGAVRYTNYNISGGTTTWKGSVNYSPIEDLRLRATKSKDIRAPDLTELFSPTVFSFQGQVTDPSHGNVPVFAQAFSGGSTALTPEVGKTDTIGLVYSPSWIPRLNISIDYYSINITAAITTLSPQGIVNACATGATSACGQINKSNPALWIIQAPTINLASVKTTGVDYAARYSLPIGADNLAVSLLANYTGKYTTHVAGAKAVQQAGYVGGISAAQAYDTPNWSGTFQLDYSHEKWDLFVQERFIGSGKYEATFVQGVDINNNSVPSAAYTDLTVRRKFGAKDTYEAYLNVSNLFNKAPPLAPQQSGDATYPTNIQLYDAIGRYFTVGLKARF
ncbi:TonB-dependent receptor domain-containing protein [Phenylobacterium sp.]|uniref:TonB-dependent receptor domain-containing protein n=1 Tax=Phenylobacterium sp. TaxID=1871053 RepID=UPI002E37B856|nr:TonB-dependent receptor [Phenylobacterium sp.]HEX3364635.1 TonB-dependent receptor [Phenylobacterium sp.]